jgi:ATP-binding cassette subfamily F protein 3
LECLFKPHKLSGYLVDDAGEDEDVLQVTRTILESAAKGKEDIVLKLVSRLENILGDQLASRRLTKGPQLLKLDKIMEMSKGGAMSNTIAFTEGVDLESINKSKCVEHTTGRASQTDYARQSISSGR